MCFEQELLGGNGDTGGVTDNVGKNHCKCSYAVVRILVFVLQAMKITEGIMTEECRVTFTW
jgi:hypothetical protein